MQVSIQDQLEATCDCLGGGGGGGEGGPFGQGFRQAAVRLILQI